MTAIKSILARSALLALIAIGCSMQSVRAADFEAANRAYEQGDFEAARKEYQALIEAGKGNANVFYNLGNAAFRAGDLGSSVLGYERALALEPAHPEARRNLAVARERAGARLPEREWYDRLFPAWRGDIFVLTATVAIWVALFSFVFSRVYRSRGGGFGGLGFVALLVAIYAGAGFWHTERDRSLAIITAKEAVARLAPADQSGVAGTLPGGSRVRVLSERGDWVYCQMPGTGLGWLPAATVQRVRLKT